MLQQPVAKDPMSMFWTHVEEIVVAGGHQHK